MNSQMKCANFRSLDEKQISGSFDYHFVSDFSDLCQKLKGYQNDGYCFRGQRDALWRIVSYAQRSWNDWRCRACVVDKVTYQHYLSMALEYAKQNVEFPSCNLSCRNVSLRDHERWGYLQHYSWPTPFVDFSDNMDVALFMAVQNIDLLQQKGHFSIYAIKPEVAFNNENYDLDQWVRDVGEGDEQFYVFHKWCDIHTWIMHKESGSWCPEISCGRMASQGGLFVYLNSADVSLEEEFAKKHELDCGETKAVDGLFHDRIVCFDVPYSLVPYVKAYLLDKNVNTETLGLADRSRDTKIQVQYQNFKKFFLEQCSLLNRRISVAGNTYMRSLGDQFLAHRPDLNASMLVRCVGGLDLRLQKGYNRCEDVIAGLAVDLECSFATVLDGYGPLLEDMLKNRLIIDSATRGRVDESVECRSTDKTESGAEGRCNDVLEDAVNRFYISNHLPKELHIDLTDACTERCVHCYVPKGQKDYLPVEFVEKALVEFRAMNGLTVHLTGGEAMMHPDFERICRKCVELNLNFIILSNMTLCDEKRIAFLKEVQPQFINVSLYSMKPEEHDAITQLPGSWRKTLDAILKCCEAGVACRIATPLLKENQNALPELRKFADEHRMHLVPSADIIAQADHGCMNLEHICSTAELRQVLVRDHGLFHKFYTGEMPSCDEKVCEIGSGRIHLNAKGNYYACDSMHEYVLGNVRENTVEEIWKGEKLNYLRGLKNRDFGECASCENRPWCKVCPAANFNATGDLFKHHPNTCALAGVVREVYGKELKDGNQPSSM